jgi:hypothetical protein
MAYKALSTARGRVVSVRGYATAFAVALACALTAAATRAEPGRLVHERTPLQSRSNGDGITTYWGEGASYEIVGPGMTVFFMRRDDGKIVTPMIRVTYVGDSWIHAQSVTFTVGERVYGPFDDVYSTPTRTRVGPSLVVEALMFPIDTDEKWRMVEGIGEAAELGRPVIVVFDGDTRYGIEVDRASKRATGSAIDGFRQLRTH